MAFWKLPEGCNNVQAYPGGVTSRLTRVTVTAGGTPHVKTAWNAIVTTGTDPAYGFWAGVSCAGISGTNTSTLMDIGLGGAGSEQTIVLNYPIGYTFPNAPFEVFHFFPLYIPASTAVSVKIQSARASMVANVGIVPNTGHNLIDAGESYGSCIVYGTDTSTSKGVNVTAGNGAFNATPAQLTASTTAPIHAMGLLAQGGGATGAVGGGVRAQIMQGAGGSEVAIGPDVFLENNASEYMTYLYGQVGANTPANGYNIPTGQRLAVHAYGEIASIIMDFSVVAYTR